MLTNNSQDKYISTPKGWSARLISRIRNRAKNKGIECDLDVPWLREKLGQMKCEVTGMPFNPRFWAAGPKGPWSPSVDRIDPKKGYIKDNCQLVIWMYNAAKQEFSHDDVVLFASALAKEGAIIPTASTEIRQFKGFEVVPSEVVEFIKRNQ